MTEANSLQHQEAQPLLTPAPPHPLPCHNLSCLQLMLASCLCGSLTFLKYAGVMQFQ